MELGVKIKNIHKRYRLGVIGSGSLKDDLQLLYAKLMGKNLADFYKIGDNDRLIDNSEYIWALQDINIEVKKGEVLGIIGKNGAGKSTLLKILSKVTMPSEGNIFYNGRMASLLEVGTGFHPELTGEENIFLNGAILGMSKSEISSKLDEIIEFSGIGNYIHTPVKRYSSGMRVRLAFAVAAHLEPEILVIDEVLAVGDVEFQNKAVGKMKNVSKEDGRTVLFVSHNMAAVKSLCDRAVVMDKGKIVFEGNPNDAVEYYLELNKNNEDFYPGLGNEKVEISSIDILPFTSKGNIIYLDSGIKIKIGINVKTPKKKISMTINIFNANEVLILHEGVFLWKDSDYTQTGNYEIKFTIPSNILNAGNYRLGIQTGESGKYLIFKYDNIYSFEIQNIYETDSIRMTRKFPGILKINTDKEVKYLGSK